MKRVWVVVFLGLISAWLSPPQAARAQSETAYDLINTINTLRHSLGLAAYTIDPWLMSYAQEHADYIDSLNSGTHIHSDGTLPWDSGIQENVAGGSAGYVTVAVVVYQIWVDEGHLKTMTGYPGGEIGAGVAYSADNEQTYFVIDVRPAAEEGSAAPAPAATAGFLPTGDQHAAGGRLDRAHGRRGADAMEHCHLVWHDGERDPRAERSPANSTVIYVGQELKIIQAAAVIPPTLSGRRRRQWCSTARRPASRPAQPPSPRRPPRRSPARHQRARPPTGCSGCRRTG